MTNSINRAPWADAARIASEMCKTACAVKSVEAFKLAAEKCRAVADIADDHVRTTWLNVAAYHERAALSASRRAVCLREASS